MLNLSIRSLSTAAIGILLLLFREQAMPAIVMCVGGLFSLPALIALIIAVVPMLKNNEGAVNAKNIAACIVSAGSLFLGLWMLFEPTIFVAILMSVLGVMLSMAGAMQITALLRVCRKVKISLYLYIVPFLIFVAGIVTLLYPFKAASLPFLILGIAAIFSAVSDMINTIFISRYLPNDVNSGNVVDTADEK